MSRAERFSSTPSTSKAEHFLEIFFVADQAVDVRDEFLGDLLGLLAAPELGAEIQVVADDRAGFVGGDERFLADGRACRRRGR